MSAPIFASSVNPSYVLSLAVVLLAGLFVSFIAGLLPYDHDEDALMLGAAR